MTLAKRANPSSTNMPPKARAVPAPWNPIQAATAISTALVTQTNIGAHLSLPP